MAELGKNDDSSLTFNLAQPQLVKIQNLLDIKSYKIYFRCITIDLVDFLLSSGSGFAVIKVNLVMLIGNEDEQDNIAVHVLKIRNLGTSNKTAW